MAIFRVSARLKLSFRMEEAAKGPAIFMEERTCTGCREALGTVHPNNTSQNNSGRFSPSGIPAIHRVFDAQPSTIHGLDRQGRSIVPAPKA